MSTYGDLLDDTQQFLYGFGADRDKLTSLSVAIDADDFSFRVADGGAVDRGFVEIDNELLEVASVDRNSGVVTIHPFGRGSRGTAPEAHMVGSRVTNAPRFPRARVRVEVSNAINSLYPDLYTVARDESITANAARVTYPLPSSTEGIVSVSGQTLGPSGMWRPISRYRFDYLADTTAFPSGKSIDVYEPVAPGRPIKVLYKKRPAAGVDTDTLADLGIEDSWRDLIRLKATAQLLLGLEPVRLNVESIESIARQDQQQPAMAAQVAKQLLQVYQIRLTEEKRTLAARYPLVANWQV